MVAREDTSNGYVLLILIKNGNYCNFKQILPTIARIITNDLTTYVLDNQTKIQIFNII